MAPVPGGNSRLHKCIGFAASKPLLERAVLKTYGLHLNDALGPSDLAIGIPGEDLVINGTTFRDTGRIVVAEDHLAHGGLGSAVAMSAARQHPIPMRFVNLRDTFAESGTPEGLLAKLKESGEIVLFMDNW